MLYLSAETSWEIMQLQFVSVFILCRCFSLELGKNVRCFNDCLFRISRATPWKLLPYECENMGGPAE